MLMDDQCCRTAQRRSPGQADSEPSAVRAAALCLRRSVNAGHRNESGRVRAVPTRANPSASRGSTTGLMPQRSRRASCNPSG